MVNIGTFKKSGPEFQGEIRTLSVQAKGVRIVPETTRGNDNAPSHRVFASRAEIGAAWSSAPTRAATISRSSWTIRASAHRSTPTCSTTPAAARPSPSSGPPQAERRLSRAANQTRPGKPGLRAGGAVARLDHPHVRPGRLRVSRPGEG